jgi:hypothetical protein
MNLSVARWRRLLSKSFNINSRTGTMLKTEAILLMISIPIELRNLSRPQEGK